MVVEQVSDVERFAGLRGAWEELWSQSGASVFSSWAWLHSWYRRWSAGRRLCLLVTRDEPGRLLGVLPLYLEERRSFGRSCRRLGLLGDERVGSDHLGPLLRRDAAGEVLAGWARWLLAHRPEWDLLELLDVDAGAAWLPALRAPLQVAGLGLQEEPRCECPFDTFEPGLGFDHYLAKKAKRAENYRRRRRWLERQPGYRIDRVEDGDRLEEALATFFHLHRMRWQERSALAEPEVEAFHREAAPRLASAGQLRLYTMQVGGRAVASVYALRGNGVLSYFNAGYDPAWRDKSVGLVLVGATFQDAIEEGLREYDFLRGMEPYKQDWTSQVRRTAGVRAWWRDGPGAWDTRARGLDRGARAALRSALPPAVLSGLRRLRRRWEAR